MPTSDKQGKWIASLMIEDACPDVIWDVGAGQGTYYDLMKHTNAMESQWIGVEIWQPYIEEYNLRDKYFHVYNRDIREMDLSSVNKWAERLIIFGDVLEHMPEDDARRLILKAKQNFRYILVSIPIIHAPQGEVNGNPYEAHLKHWTFDEMHDVMGKCMSFKGHTIGLYWWDSKEDV